MAWEHHLGLYSMQQIFELCRADVLQLLWSLSWAPKMFAIDLSFVRRLSVVVGAHRVHPSTSKVNVLAPNAVLQIIDQNLEI